MRNASPTILCSIRLRDGRRLAYSAMGAADGFPVLYLHGAIGSPRWRTPALDAAVAALGIRYVVVDRPAFGDSDPHPGRTVADFARDIEQLADALGLRRFAVVGVSAGAPYALACAWAMPERVAATAAVSSLPPPGGGGRSGVPRFRYRTPLIAFGAPGLGPALAGAALRVLGLRRSTAPRAMIADYEVCCRPWGFEPAEIPGRVDLWHARRDRLVPLAHALRLASALPACKPALEPSGGHFFFRSRTLEILGSLVQTGRYAPTEPVGSSLRAAAA
jgi:pimeloyl-ACP methyl ester carboxylesterase